ncbi:hypothetical protein DAPPUDRAFT_247832 [Daphnia pulex]|uniref:Uncharacterized protein n=1 Tax=Daphnia pulex TaxID=6669 RepID=E9GSY8_DAPPU|nr:hypothetical protein DAPPUDRAFT_247832 [Daphnia pulex]|eukprot:EFX77363.1 hypothetical protein DAPPUDRAFT_247832 [Daphnia pulex]
MNIFLWSTPKILRCCADCRGFPVIPGRSTTPHTVGQQNSTSGPSANLQWVLYPTAEYSATNTDCGSPSTEKPSTHQ